MNEANTWAEIAELTRTPEEVLQECERQPYQSSGAGGQKRNRTYSAIRLVHPTGYRAEAGDYREAGRNLTLALHRLRREIALGLRGKDLSGLLASPDPVATFLETVGDWPTFRYPVNAEHPDRANFIALAIVLLRLFQGKPGPVAAKLGASTSAFVKFCKQDPALWRFVQELRTRHDLPPLK